MGAVGEFLAYNNLLPHGHCLFWRPDLLMLHVISDALIALAYFSIPVTLLELLRRRKDLVFNQIFLMFAAFILACGITHVLSITDIWFGLYPVSGLMKAFTAVISIITAITCWRLLPQIQALPSPNQLQEEVARRVDAEKELRSINYDLEERINERTEQVNLANKQLREEIKAREQSQDRAEFLAAVVHFSDDSILRMDLQGTIQSWNAGAEKLYGYSEAEMLGKNIKTLTPPEDTNTTSLLELAEQDQEHKSISTETVRMTKSGERIHVLITISPVKDQAGEIAGYACIARDIQDRIDAEQQVRDLASIVQFSDDAIVRLNLEGIVQSWNAGAQKIYGYTEQEMVGKHIDILFPKGSASAVTLLNEAQHGTEWETMTNETLRITKSGKKLHVLLTMSPIKDNSGKTIGFVGISRSIQKRIEAEQQLRENADELLEANADLKDFVYIASHDLQEPLRLITSYLNILNEDYGDKFDDDGKRYMGYTLESADRLQHLILDLLGYSRLTTSEEPLTACASAETIQEALDDLKLIVDNSSATIVIDDNLPTLVCDQIQLRLLFQNLISNSIKYSKEDEPPRIHISAIKTGEEYQFTIEDNGIGFETKHAERIFQVFRRLHARHKYEGTGIGLAICKKIVGRHGGEIWAESVVGKGSKFHFTISNAITQPSAPQKALEKES